MSRILRRPMFRGGKVVSSYGNGIASGLAEGGRVNFNQGGSSGMDFLKKAFLGPRFNDPNYVSPMKFQSGTGFGFMSPEKQAPGLIAIGQGTFNRRPELDSLGFETGSRRKNFSPALEKEMKESDEQGVEDINEDENLSEDFYKKLGVENVDTSKYEGGKKGSDNKGGKIEVINSEIDVTDDKEESTELTVKDYIKMLGGDKARRRDTSDLLAKASAAFLKEGGVKEGFATFMDKVATSGPGRLEKIEQAAATLDIKDKIATKRADEQLKMLLGKADYEAMLRLRMSDPSLQSFETNLEASAKSLGKRQTNMGVIANAINKKYGSGSFGGEVAENKDYVEGKFYIKDTGTGEKIIFKIIKGDIQEVHRIR